MDGMAYKHYFFQPLDVWHRRYEALRAVFVDGHSLQDAAQCFGVRYGTVRNWVSEFRRQLDTAQRPPFLRRRSVVDRQSLPTTLSRQSPSPISKRCPWSRGGG